MAASRFDPFGDMSAAYHRSPGIINLNQVSVSNIPFFRIQRMEPDRPIGIPIFFDAVLRNIIQPETLIVIMGMIREPGMGADQLQRVL
jgi:hypothetical protein